MRKILAITSLISVFIFCTISCSNYDKKFSKLNSDSWKSDTSGCNGYRHNNYQQLINEKEVILGLSETELKSLLGVPNKINLYDRGQKFFIYHVDCHDEMVQSGQSIRIRFNAIGMVSEVLVVSN